MLGHGLDRGGSGYGHMARACKCGNENEGNFMTS